MKISTERQLVEKLSQKLKAQFHTDIVINEFSAGYGIADIVFAKNFFSTENLIGRQPLNNYYALKALLSLEKKAIFTHEDLSKSIGLGINTTRNVLTLLIKDNYIEKISKSHYIKTFDINNPIKNLVAIEVKLKDWKHGIMQARRYKTFTNESYLAILSDYEKNIDYNYLEQFGIGLIIFDTSSGDIILKKKPNTVVLETIYDDANVLYAKEHFLHCMSSKTF